MVNIVELKREQIELAKKIVTADKFEKAETIAGVDQASYENDIISAIVVCDAKNMKVLEEKYAIDKAPIPYIPGYLSYREMPIAIKAFHRIETKPDITIFDGNGILHPRRIGIASHFGLLTDRAVIGVAKKLLCGNLQDGKVEMDKEIRAIELKTRDVSNPIYVSPGHKISLQTAVKIIKDTIKGHKLPEPLYLAHKYANKVKKNLKEEQ